ncbi:MAG: SPOR domain-containing protein [Candidatus Eremiobacteraeota bacterium]|nr:SPOR domain-containing protein [Candidatus Eremiobacteraeota bacterium]MCW5871416.1 SPOR domain-containing protein [Candidatus Eremiobacteraeota bacterium]
MSFTTLLCSRTARIGLLLAALAGTSALTQAQQPETPAQEDYAILIVGDESDANVLLKEKVLIQEMAKSLKKPYRLPIYSYHFNKERERTYCEKKLNVLREDLLFIGLVSLKDRVPRKIVFRIDRIVTPSRAAAEIVARADELSPEATPSASPSPETPTAPASPGGAGRFRVQLGVFAQQKSAQDLSDQLKAKGYEAKLEKITGDGGKDNFKVWVGSFQTREDAQQATTELQADGFSKGFVVETP